MTTVNDDTSPSIGDVYFGRPIVGVLKRWTGEWKVCFSDDLIEGLKWEPWYPMSVHSAGKRSSK
jgi:hypothetical protein